MWFFQICWTDRQYGIGTAPKAVPSLTRGHSPSSQQQGRRRNMEVQWRDANTSRTPPLCQLYAESGSGWVFVCGLLISGNRMVAVAGWRKYIGDVLRCTLERRKGNEGRRWNRETGIFICQEQLKKEKKRNEKDWLLYTNYYLLYSLYPAGKNCVFTPQTSRFIWRKEPVQCGPDYVVSTRWMTCQRRTHPPASSTKYTKQPPPRISQAVATARHDRV